MNNFFIILFINLLTISISAQDMNPLISNKTENNASSKIEGYILLEKKIKASISENDRLKEAELMAEYIHKPELESIIKSRRNRLIFNPRDDTMTVYLNKSLYSKKLANFYHLKKEYSNAQSFLNIHEAKYLFPHPCGNGYMSDSLKRTILYAEIHQGLEKHNAVIKKLLPLTFEYSMQGFGNITNAQIKIDSILLISLKTKYSVSRIKKEFERCAKGSFNAPPTNRMFYGTEIEIFDETFKIFADDFYRRQMYKKYALYDIKEEIERKKSKDEIDKKSYIKAILTNRIYKRLQGKD